MSSDDSGRLSRVLVIEDDDIIRSVTRKLLESSGYAVVEAQDGVSGMTMLKDLSCHYGLIMLDVTLPGASGREVFDCARDVRKDVPVVLMSGYNEASIKHDIGIEGHDGFLKKPFDADSMINMVSRFCECS